MQKYRVLLLGGGGREHTLAWKLAQSPLLEKLFVAPGNGGTDSVAETASIDPLRFEEVASFVRKEKIDILVVGPEEPLVKGIADFLKQQPDCGNLCIVGPEAEGAQLEGSKSWSKQFMQKYGIPTARYKSFTEDNRNEAVEFVETLSPPYVIKASGLAAGKGVFITPDKKDAIAIIDDLLGGCFGDAGKELVIEEFLDGIEVSVFILTDGTDYILLPEAKDYKRIGDGNTGPNTGGMGAVSPVPFVTSEFMDKITQRIILPTLDGLRKENIPYRGFIFFGLIKVNDEPYVIEYNARMGDPETEAVMPRLKNDLLELFVAMHTGSLSNYKALHHPQTAVTLVLASGGYPGNYSKGHPIECEATDADGLVFHAGTKKHENTLVTSGGRVMAITALADTLTLARHKAYETASKIRFLQKYHRNDIGNDLM